VKKVDELTADDIARNPVWRFTNSDSADETAVQPVKRLPVSNLAGKLVGLRVTLRNGDSVWATLSNIDSENARLNEHFLTLSVVRLGMWFHLARYHDFDYAERGPDALAAFLGLDVDDVFPISYDLCAYAKGDPRALSGVIAKSPAVKLTRAELIRLAIP
jgi:hypothetical protein